MLRKLLVASLFVCLLCIGAVGAGYAYLNWQAGEYAQSLKNRLPPGVSLTYDSVEVELLERAVSLRNVSLQAPAFVSDADFVSVRLVMPSWLTFIDLEDQLAAGRLPEAIQLQQQGLIVDLDNPLFVQLLDTHDAAVANTSAQDQFCGTRGGLDLISAVGYSALVADSELGIYTPVGRGLRIVELKTNLRELGELLIEVVFILPQDFTGSFNPETSVLKEIRVNFQDHGYNQRYRNFCRESLKLDDRELSELLQTSTIKAFGERGLVGYQNDMVSVANIYQPEVKVTGVLPVGKTYPQVFSAFAQNPEAFVESSQPLMAIGGQILSKPFLRALANNVILGEKPKTDLIVTEAPVPSEPKQIVPLSRESKTDDANNQTLQATPYDRGGSGYKVVGFAQASQYAGQRAKVLTQFGRRLEGKIIKVSQGVLHFEHRFSQGAATYKLRADQIEKLWVYMGDKG